MKISINGKQVEVDDEGITVFEACRRNGVYIPTLCHHPRLPPAGKCKVCIVEIEGSDFPFVTSCSTPIEEGMAINTTNPAVKAKQAAAISILAGSAPQVFGDTEMDMIVRNTLIGPEQKSNCIYRDMSKCVGCTRCVRACSELQGMNCLEVNPEGTPLIRPVGAVDLADGDCISCGQCAVFCPTDAITEVSHIERIEQAMAAGKVVTLQVAPSPRVALGECFGQAPGTITTPKLVGAAKALGFNYVFDTNLAADLTIMEEGSEFLQRVEKGGPFPMFTSCCPGWVNMVEKLYPEFRENLSTCRSPQQMLNPVIKTFWAKNQGIKPEDIYSVALMPCTAKKDEIAREQMFLKGGRDPGISEDMPSGDAVLTTREFAKMMKKHGMMDYTTLPEMEYDDPLGVATGAGAIFGVTGGVMEAALRTAYELKTGKPLPTLTFEPCRGFKHMKKFEVDLDGHGVIKIAVVHSLKFARELLAMMKKGEMLDYHFIEIMACEGGCIGGGGMPRNLDPDILQKRMEAIYTVDQKSVLRRSHENPAVQKIYDDLLGKPLGHMSHNLLHTVYTDRSKPALKDATAETATAGAESGGILLLYGSQSGTAHRAAKSLEYELNTKTHHHVRCLGMDQYDAEDLVKEETVLFVCSTFGVGEFPSNAVKFWEKLSSDKMPMLEGVKFAVFGLGSCSYKYFCKAAVLLDERMLALKAEPMMEIVKGNETDVGGINAEFDPWTSELLKMFGGSAESLFDLPEPRYQVSIAVPTSGSVQPTPPGYSICHLSEDRLLSAEGYDREQKLFGFDLTGTGLTYSVGDHLAILPRNPEAMVQDFLKLYSLDGKLRVSVCQLGDGAGVEEEIFPPVLTVHELLSQYLDLCSPPTRKFVRQLSLFAEDEAQKRELLDLSDQDNKAKFDEYIAEYSIYDTLARFSSAVLPLDQLLTMTPTIQPRLYSIGSSGKLLPSTVELLVVLYKWRTPKGVEKTGLTTNHLWSLDSSARPRIAVQVRKGILNPPEDPTLPLLMFGLGSGLAPFRGFLQEREALVKEGAAVGPATLYFGCRLAEKDFACEGELKNWVETGVLTHLEACFSHTTPDRLKFIPEEIQDKPEPVQRAVMCGPEGVQMYYCGVAMGVPQKIVAAVGEALEKGAMTAEEAAKWLSTVDTGKPATSRWHVECF